MSDNKGKGKAKQEEMEVEDDDDRMEVDDDDRPETKSQRSERIAKLIYAGRLSEASEEIHGEVGLKLLKNSKSTTVLCDFFFFFSFILTQA